jgi:DNA-binding NtrC family response regulator
MSALRAQPAPAGLRQPPAAERHSPGPPGHACLQVLQDPRSRALLQAIRRIAPTDAPVLLIAESGSGKDGVAHALHAASARSQGPYVAVNCGAYPADSLEGELFGQGRGGLPGAFGAHAGRLQAGDGGSVFLDEIDRLPLHLQARLLQLLQARRLVRGGPPLPADIRLISATACDLGLAVREGRFRDDLYHVLRATPLRVPALRERPGDIVPLARHFLAVLGQRLNCPPRRFSAAAEARLLAHDWPGNLRELENVVHRALLVDDDDDGGGGGGEAGEIGEHALSLGGVRPGGTALPPDHTLATPALAALQEALQRLFDAPLSPLSPLWPLVERTAFVAAYEHCGHNQVQAARLLGISRNVLRARLIALGVVSARR